jgi:hypothetical protein
VTDVQVKIGGQLDELAPVFRLFRMDEDDIDIGGAT